MLRDKGACKGKTRHCKGGFLKRRIILNFQLFYRNNLIGAEADESIHHFSGKGVAYQ